MGNLKKSGEKYSWETRFRLTDRKQEYKDKRLSFHISRNDSHDTILIKCREPTREYLDWFWRSLQLKTIPMDWALKIFPNVKEQTESVAALFGVKDILSLKESIVIVVGDGSSPRCRGLFAFFSKEVISVDPEMRAEFCSQKTITNLSCVASTIEKWIEERKGQPLLNKPVVVVAMHTHVTFQVYLESLLSCISADVPLVILSVACCYDLYLSKEEVAKYGLTTIPEYDDWAMHSPCRTVRRWTRNIAPLKKE